MPEADPTTARAPRTVAVLTNPAAGRGGARSARDAVVRHLRDAGIAVQAIEGRDAGDALGRARRLVTNHLQTDPAQARSVTNHHDQAAGAPPQHPNDPAEPIDALVVVGGDGTVNLGLQATAGTDVPLGIIPAGTGNDIARCVDLVGDGVTPQTLAARIAAGQPRRIDLAQVGERRFATVLAAGFDAKVNERANTMRWPRGPMRYNLAIVAELRTFRPISYVLDLDGTTLRAEAMLVAVGNGPSFGGGMRIAEGARLDDGLLDVVLIGPMSRPRLVRLFPQIYSGAHVERPEFTRHRVRRVTVAAPGIVGYADGERLGPLPLSVECLPGAGRIL